MRCVRARDQTPFSLTEDFFQKLLLFSQPGNGHPAHFRAREGEGGDEEE